MYKEDLKIFPKSVIRKLKLFNIKEIRDKMERVDDKYLYKYYVKPKSICHKEEINKIIQIIGRKYVKYQLMI